MDGMLSQEEINALLSGMGGDDPVEEPVVSEPEVSESNSAEEEVFLSDLEKDMVGEISNISMGTAATTLSSLVNQKVNISIPVVSYAKWENLVDNYARPCVFLQIQYREGLDGNNILILKDHDVKVIADLMMGGDGTNTDVELGELQLSAICEAMNQMMGSASTSLSSMLNMKIDISPPTASLVDLNESLDEREIAGFLSNGFVKNSFEMTIGDLVDSEIMQLFPVDFAKNLCRSFAGEYEEELNASPVDTSSSQMSSAAPEPLIASMGTAGFAEPAPSAPVSPPQPMASQPVTPQPTASPPQMASPDMNPYGMPMGAYPGMQQPMGYPAMPYGMPYGQPMQMPPMHEVNVQPAQFQAFNESLSAVTQKENIDLIMDVPLEVTVELGRTSKSIQDILEFAPGTIIELDKIAGEPIDVLVNGKFVAKGEVVVIEESFGIRVTEIVK